MIATIKKFKCVLKESFCSLKVPRGVSLTDEFHFCYWIWFGCYVTVLTIFDNITSHTVFHIKENMRPWRNTKCIFHSTNDCVCSLTASFLSQQRLFQTAGEAIWTWHSFWVCFNYKVQIASRLLHCFTNTFFKQEECWKWSQRRTVGLGEFLSVSLRNTCGMFCLFVCYPTHLILIQTRYTKTTFVTAGVKKAYLFFCNQEISPPMSHPISTFWNIIKKGIY